MLTIDGSRGEGGGQVLRTALSLSLVTGKAFHLHGIRARRPRPGLMRQHLTAVRTAGQVADAVVKGAELGSRELRFSPGPVSAGAYHAAIGTAGSATLVLQTVLPALLNASAPSTLKLEGGTHNPAAPPYDFLAKAFLPLVERMGPRVDTTLVRPGFYPAGGGKFHASVEPASRLRPLVLESRGHLQAIDAVAAVANLPTRIAERELAVIGEALDLPAHSLHAERVANSRGPGNVVMVEVRSEHATEVFSAFGERGIKAEAVAAGVVRQVREYLATSAAVGEYLADQLVLPLALAGEGRFTASAVSQHLLTNVEVIKMFLDVEIDIGENDAGDATISVRRIT